MNIQKLRLNLPRQMVLLGLLIFSLSVVSAAELRFDPKAPSVVVGGKISLSVSGTSGAVTWFAGKGEISGTGTQVTYWAPDQVGNDVVTVLDDAGNTGVVKIVILPEDIVTPSLENAAWEIFTNRDWVAALALSEDEETLWVGTEGGLEQRDAATGELVRVFTNLDGLPSNTILALLGDDSGGLWIGTYDGGLAYLSQSGEWRIYNTDNSDLPNNEINALLGDDSGGLWIGTWGSGLAYLSQSGEWRIYNTENSGLPLDNITALLGDDSGGLWIGTSGSGLAYLSQSGEWSIY